MGRASYNFSVKSLLSICISLECCDTEFLHSCSYSVFQTLVSLEFVVPFSYIWKVILHLKLSVVLPQLLT